MQKAIHPYQLLRFRWAVTALAVLLAFVLGAPSGWAQSQQGSILGTVKDASGAMVAGATVTLTNTDEGVVRTTKTNASGDYLFLDAIADHYDIEVAASGFQDWKLSG